MLASDFVGNVSGENKQVIEASAKKVIGNASNKHNKSKSVKCYNNGSPHSLAELPSREKLAALVVDEENKDDHEDNAPRLCPLGVI